MTPAADDEGASADSSVRHQYRTVAGYEMDARRLRLRGGIYDGGTWVGVVAVGDRVFCGGNDPWSTDGIYLVSNQIEVDDQGPANTATPAFASE
jgi:hypothetical protein